MSVSLSKGQGVSLKKNEYDLSSVTIGLGWDINEEKKGFLGGIFGKKEEYDLDVIAFLCNSAGKVTDLGNVENGKPTLVNGDIIFFNSLRHKSGNIWLTGDNRTGAGDGDDEQIIVRLNSLDAQYEKIVFIVQIYNGEKLQQHFDKVQNAFIRAVDARNIEMARFDLSGGPAFASQRSMVFAELIREATGWKLRAIGESSESDSFVSHLRNYM
ncbi:TerD family protein [Escherichia coli]|jgi:stress response protein SCP2|uniref:TerD family protein n=1 Tax=Escherichia coli TaxID=562 RepID=UPI0018165FC9|nr:TerD family protein [Escherichia coli]EJD2849341.1 TerD family protein [Escherichia coli]EKC9660969.1 TerD family protein [Escherichia coli]EKE5258357.1 TerD family protein [Escherichia coli]EKF3080206.1 TerD family protein [Escherichia coli]